jgi:aldehyde dehydrogenase (NAD+)
MSIDALNSLRHTFQSGRTRAYSWRIRQLARLKEMLVQREPEFIEALHADLGKCRLEAWCTEISVLIAEIDYARKHLRRWMKPEKVSTPLVAQPGRATIVREPLGVVLVISPWNYPLQLTLLPLAGALAAGNCALIKPSEHAPHTADALAKWLPEYLDQGVSIVLGGPDETAALLEERFDHIFFTGGATVARRVMEAAAKHLTPVTLELGGKSPCLVDQDADLTVTARRIAWAKFLNARQTCVAPDYVLVPERLEQDFLTALTGQIRQFYGADPQQSADYGRIVNQRHHQRLVGLLRDGEIVIGGQHDEATKYLAPTILRGVSPDSPSMQEEIFGPVLPVLTVRDMDEAIAFVQSRPRPLALYAFTGSAERGRQVVQRTQSGSVCINDGVLQLAVPGLPFGGIGPSGMGAYHGRYSFETFSHRKAVLQRSTWFDLPLRYPPYSDRKLRWLRRILGGFGS